MESTSAIIYNPLVIAPERRIGDAAALMDKARLSADAASSCSGDDPDLRDPLLQKGRSSCVVVVEGGRVIGLLTETNIVRCITGPQPATQVTVAEAMDPPQRVLRECELTSAEAVLKIGQQTGYAPLPLLNQGGQLIGLLTPESFLWLSHQLLQPKPDEGQRGLRETTVPSADASSFSAALKQPPTATRDQATYGKNGLPIASTMLHDIISHTKACISHFRLFPDATWQYDFFSEGSELIFGFSPQELMSQPELWATRVAAEDFQNVIIPAVQAVQQGQDHLDLEFRFRHRDASIRWIGESCHARWDDNRRCWVVTNVAIDITERKQIEAYLRQSEAELRALFEAMDDLVIVLDSQGRYLKVVTKDASKLCRPAPQLMGKTLEEVFPPEQADRFLAIIHTVLETQTAEEFEYILTIDGKERWFSAKCSAIDADQVVWVARDVSDRKHNELTLRKSEAKRRAVLAEMPDLMFRLGADGRYREVINPRPDLELFFQGRDPVGQRLVDLVPAEIARRKLAMKDQALATGKLQLYEQQMQTENGPRYEEVRVIKSDEDEVLFMIRDISDRKIAEKTLKRQLAAIEAAVDGIGILQGETYLYLNQSHGTLFGYDKATDLVGKTWRELYSPEEIQRFEQEVFPILQRDRVWQGEAIALRRDGSTFPEGLSLTLTDDDFLICVCRDISELKQAQAQIIHNALHDPLTGLPNRTLLEERLDIALQRAKRYPHYHYAVLFIDLDRFKVINDSLGHLVGDQLLIAIAKRLQTHTRSVDLAARLGGDEFVLLLEEVENPETVAHIVERILDDCQNPFMIEGHEVFTGMSIGIALGNNNYTLASDVIQDADIAMYRAKQNRQASYQFFGSAMRTAMIERHTLEMELHRPIELNELVVHYQPIFDLVTPQLVGFEALVRWHHPVRGYLTPDTFLTCAEESGLIVPIDRWVLAQAGHQLHQWQTRFSLDQPLKMHVNLSAQQFTTGNLLSSIDQAVAEVGLAYPWLAIEITENVLIDNIDRATMLLNQLAERHIQASIDDFGIGYSSLQYLHRLPLKSLKIDRSFVHQIDTSDRDYQMVKTIVGLGRQLNLSIIAEGIENQHHLRLIQALGCEFGQGYLFARPLPADQIEPFLLSLRQENE
jgi:diguanylate cyclase (GGDEF)-like protein/PAS domain S-box-containing protein